MNIYIKNEQELNKKINQIKKDGINKLHFVADFDRTITKASHKGKEAPNSFYILKKSKLLAKDYAEKDEEMEKIYLPIEYSKKIHPREKAKKMQEWWEKHLQLSIDSGLNTKVLQEVIEVTKKESRVREGTKELLETLNKHNIPICIFSAGMGDVIEGFLKAEKALYKNTHIVSNFFKFNNKGELIGFKKEIIHTYNKNEFQIKNHNYYSKIKDRKNVILIGDAPGDSEMVEGLQHKTIIKIGFLNKDIQENLRTYSRLFDVVITNDGPMDYINNLLKEILK